MVPVIRDLHQAAEDVRAAELERARRSRWRAAGRQAVLEQLAHGLTQKYLHGPLAALNRSSGEGPQAAACLDAALFPGRDSRR